MNLTEYLAIGLFALAVMFLVLDIVMSVALHKASKFNMQQDNYFEYRALIKAHTSEGELNTRLADIKDDLMKGHLTPSQAKRLQDLIMKVRKENAPKS